MYLIDFKYRVFLRFEYLIRFGKLKKKSFSFLIDIGIFIHTIQYLNIMFIKSFAWCDNFVCGICPKKLLFFFLNYILGDVHILNGYVCKLCSNFDGVAISEENLGTIFPKHFWTRRWIQIFPFFDMEKLKYKEFMLKILIVQLNDPFNSSDSIFCNFWLFLKLIFQ